VTCDIGIVSFDCFPLLEKCLDSLYEHERPLPGKVIVVENGPNDIPESLIKRFDERVVFLKNNVNAGFARACNQILEASSADYVCLLNPDTVIRHAFLAQAVSWLENHRDVALLGPKIVDPDGSIQGSARGFPSISTAFFGRTSFFTRFVPQNPVSRRNVQTSALKDKPTQVDWVSGACMIVRKDAVEEVGKLDEGFFMYWEDCDWCRRFWQHGWKVVYHPGLGPVEHAAGSTSKKLKLKSHYWFHKSAVRLYCKYDKTPLSIGSMIAVTGGFLRFVLLLPKIFIYDITAESK